MLYFLYQSQVDSSSLVIKHLLLIANTPSLVIKHLLLIANTPSLVIKHLLLRANVPSLVIKHLLLGANIPSLVINHLLLATNSSLFVTNNLLLITNTPCWLQTTLCLRTKSIAFLVSCKQNVSNISATILPTRGQTARSDHQNTLSSASLEKIQEMNSSDPRYSTSKDIPKKSYRNPSQKNKIQFMNRQ